MGYAAGVGKTYRMLEEAQELRHKGVDVVIGYFEPHSRQETIAKTVGLETYPRRVLAYAGSRFEEIDTDAILRRRPAPSRWGTARPWSSFRWAQSLKEFTLTGEYQMTNWLLSRLEFRDDWSSQPTVLLGMIAFFGPKK